VNAFVDHFLVGVLLVAGFGYAIYSLGPRSWRSKKAQAGCGGCDNCGSAQPTPSAEIKIPISAITRRE
jgi:hypothetical protein